MKSQRCSYGKRRCISNSGCSMSRGDQRLVSSLSFTLKVSLKRGKTTIHDWGNVHEQLTRQQTKQHSTTTPETTSKKKLPQVGLEPTTLCSLDECSSALPPELPRQFRWLGPKSHIQRNTMQGKVSQYLYYSTGSQYSVLHVSANLVCNIILGHYSISGDLRIAAK